MTIRNQALARVWRAWSPSRLPLVSLSTPSRLPLGAPTVHAAGRVHLARLVTPWAVHAAGQGGAAGTVRAEGGSCGYNGRCGVSAGGGGRVVVAGAEMGHNGEIGCMVSVCVCVW